jgi:hypothetical protein
VGDVGGCVRARYEVEYVRKVATTLEKRSEKE